MAPKKAKKAPAKPVKPPTKKEQAAMKRAAKAAKKAAKEAKPKKAPGPYMLYCKEQRPKIVAAHPEYSFGEVGKALGAGWKELSDAQKAKYKVDA